MQKVSTTGLLRSASRMKILLVILMVLLVGVAAASVYQTMTNGHPPCAHSSQNMCEVVFNVTFTTDNKEKHKRLFGKLGMLPRHCPSQRRGYQCPADTFYMCRKDDRHKVVEFCSPRQCNDTFTSCFLYFDNLHPEFVWIRLEECEYGTYPGHPFDKCNIDSRVIASEIFPDLAYCNWRESFYNKNRTLYIKKNKGREYRFLCVLDNSCPSGHVVLPDGSCSELCQSGQHRNERTGFQCRYIKENSSDEINDKNVSPKIGQTPKGDTTMIPNTEPVHTTTKGNTTSENQLTSTKSDDRVSDDIGHYRNLWTLAYTLVGILGFSFVCILICTGFYVFRQFGILPFNGCFGARDPPSVPWTNNRLRQQDTVFISGKIGKGWEQLASQLGHSMAHIQQVKLDNHTTPCMIHILLEEWRQQNQPTCETLRQHMSQISGVHIEWRVLNEKFSIE